MADKELIRTSISLQPGIWERLQNIYTSGKAGSAYLFSGPSGCGKEAIAIAFAAGLNCEEMSKIPCGDCGSCKRFRTLQHEHLTIIVPLPSSSGVTGGEKGKKTKEEEITKLFQEAIQEKATDLFFKIVFPRARQILIRSIRSLRKTLYLKSHIKGRKMVLIFDAHHLSTGQGSSGNSLLKILEEPPNNTTLVLVTDYKEQLLPTLLSRCQQVDFPPLNPEVIKMYLERTGISSEVIPFVTEISQGDMHRASSLLDKSMQKIVLLIKDLIESIFKEDSLSWRQFINGYSRLAFTDPQEFIFSFYLLQLCLRSAYRKRLGLFTDVLFAELENELASFNKKCLEIDLLRINSYLEEIVTGLNRNLNTSIALTSLLIKVHQEVNENRTDV
jgi:DNA polymerase-3 subunit delta'